MPSPKNERLLDYWDRPVKDLVTLDEPALTVGEKERHRLYSLLLMALVHQYWNGNKYGRRGTYPWNDPADAEDGEHLDRDYLGHNIAAIAVDGLGRVIDFEFNHNHAYRSSAEHAEMRLIRRVYALGQVHKSWNLSFDTFRRYASFDDTTVYTSLESCAQCAGVMALSRVRQVVYVQTDPGQYSIGNILRTMTRDTGLQSPRPISGAEIGLEHFARLDEAYGAFPDQLRERPFFVPSDPDRWPSTRVSVTSFLCTRMARAIYRDAREAFFGLESDGLEAPDFKPQDHRGRDLPGALTNAETISEMRDFFYYAIHAGARATPHH